MSDRFVTPLELDKRLEQYDRLGEGQKAAGLTEDRIKKYVRDQIEAGQSQITQLVEERAAQTFQKADIHIRKCVDTLGTQIQEATNRTIASSVDKAKRDVMTDITLAIKAKFEEARVALQNSQKSFEASLEKTFWSKLDSFQSQIRTEVSDFEKLWMEKAISLSQNSITDVKESVSRNTHLQVEDHITRIEKIIESLRADLTIEMSKKLVDKQAIEQKMRDIEAELTRKAQGVIDFNINQARAQMESAAKAEVKEGIRDAASQIMSGLS